MVSGCGSESDYTSSAIGGHVKHSRARIPKASARNWYHLCPSELRRSGKHVRMIYAREKNNGYFAEDGSDMRLAPTSSSSSSSSSRHSTTTSIATATELNAILLYRR